MAAISKADRLPDEIKEQILELGQSGVMCKEIRAIINEEHGLSLNEAQVSGHLRRGGVSIAKKSVLSADANPMIQPVEWPQNTNRVDTSQATRQVESAKINLKKNIKQSSCWIKRTIPTDRPIGLVFMSDVHIGSSAIDREALDEHLNLIEANKDALWIMKGGDWWDNFPQGFKDAGAPAGAALSPGEQVSEVENILDRFDKQIVASIAGNHDKMLAKKAGIDIDYFIYRGRSFPHLPEGGIIELTVGQQMYLILWKHEYRFNSYQNDTHAHKQMRRILCPTADIVTLEHLHKGTVESALHGGVYGQDPVVYAQSGTYKIVDPFSMYKYKPGQVSPITIVVFPDQKKMVAFNGRDAISDALALMNGLPKPVKEPERPIDGRVWLRKISKRALKKSGIANLPEKVKAKPKQKGKR